MGNRNSDDREHDSRRRDDKLRYSSENDDERLRRRATKNVCRRRGSSSSRRTSRDDGYKKSSRFWQRGIKLREEGDSLNMVNDMTQFGHGSVFGRGLQGGFGHGFGQDLERMMHQVGQSADYGSPFRSAQMFSSITTIGNDGVSVSESRGVTTNSNGRYKMAHQHRIGDRSQTLMRQREHDAEDFQEFQRLHQISHDELPRFHAEFKDRTKQWHSYHRLKSSGKPEHLAIGDGRLSRAPRSTSQMNPVYSESLRHSFDDYKYPPRGIEY